MNTKVWINEEDLKKVEYKKITLKNMEEVDTARLCININDKNWILYTTKEEVSLSNLRVLFLSSYYIQYNNLDLVDIPDDLKDVFIEFIKQLNELSNELNVFNFKIRKKILIENEELNSDLNKFIIVNNKQPNIDEFNEIVDNYNKKI